MQKIKPDNLLIDAINTFILIIVQKYNLLVSTYV